MLTFGIRNWMFANKGIGIPFKSDLNFRIISRSGNTLVDEFGNNATILNPYFAQISGNNEGFYYTDNGLFDIGNTEDMTIGCWVNFRGSTGDRAFLGKGTDGNDTISGRYHFYINGTGLNNSFALYFRDDTSLKVINSNISYKTSGWTFLMADFNQVTKIARFFINNTQIGIDTSFDSFSALNNSFKFHIACKQDSAGVLTYIGNLSDYSDVFIYRKILSTAERTAIYSNKIYPSNPKAFWYFHRLFDDISGNNYTLSYAISAPTYNNNIKYTSSILNCGIENKLASYKSDGYLDISIPYFGDTPIKYSSIPIEYNGNESPYLKTRSENKVIHNLADSFIEFSGSQWDRSNATIFNDSARIDDYDASYPKRWHISKLNIDIIYHLLNDNYKGTLFPNLYVNSYKNRQYVKEIFSYANNKTASETSSIMIYTKDNGLTLRNGNGGVCLTFDDISRSSTWKAANDVLHPVYGWKITMMLNSAPDAQQKIDIANLLSYGHEIGNHSVNHPDWQVYLQTHTIEEYISTEVLPQQTRILNNWGVTPTTFGYHQVAGHSNLLNDALFEIFTHVRPYSDLTIGTKYIDPLLYRGQSNLIQAYDIGKFSTVEATGNTQIASYLKYAKETKTVICFMLHTISMTNSGNGVSTINLSRLQYLCDYIVNNGMNFYTVDELNPSIFD